MRCLLGGCLVMICVWWFGYLGCATLQLCCCLACGLVLILGVSEFGVVLL